MKDNLLTTDQTAERIGISKKTLLQAYAPRPDFPRRISVSKKVFFFDRFEIDKWLESRKEKARFK